MPICEAFPKNFVNWSSYDSTLVYLSTLQPITISSITADGTSLTPEAWWQTGTSWTTGWPLNISQNQNVVLQINQRVSSVTLQTDKGPITASVADGWNNPLKMQALSQIPKERLFIPNASDYILAVKTPTDNNNNYTTLSVQIDNQTFNLNLNSQPNSSQYQYFGPMQLNSGSHTIITYADNKSIQPLDGMQIYSLRKSESFVSVDNYLYTNQGNNATVIYERINPTQYTVHVNTSNPFNLVFSDSFDNGWIASIDGQQLSDQYHFTANGYANGWYINKTGTYTITLEFTPQKLFYGGAAISIATLIICSLYLTRNKIKRIIVKKGK